MPPGIPLKFWVVAPLDQEKEYGDTPPPTWTNTLSLLFPQDSGITLTTWMNMPYPGQNRSAVMSVRSVRKAIV